MVAAIRPESPVFASYPASSEARMSTLDSLAIHLIRDGQWSEAVLLYRDELGVTVNQAEAKVVSLAEEYGIFYPGRWLSWLSIAFGGFSLFALAMVLQIILAG